MRVRAVCMCRDMVFQAALAAYDVKVQHLRGSLEVSTRQSLIFVHSIVNCHCGFRFFLDSTRRFAHMSSPSDEEQITTQCSELNNAQTL